MEEQKTDGAQHTKNRVFRILEGFNLHKQATSITEEKIQVIAAVDDLFPNDRKRAQPLVEAIIGADTKAQKLVAVIKKTSVMDKKNIIH